MHEISSGVSAAFGAVFIFYGVISGLVPLLEVHYFYFIIVLIAITLAGFFLSIASVVKNDIQRRGLYYIRLILAIAFGASIGMVGLYNKKQTQFYPPMPVESIQRIHLILKNDLRLLPKGALSGQGTVQFCEDSRGKRISARGIVNIIVSDSLAQLRNVAGQGSVLVVEGTLSSFTDINAISFSPPSFFVTRVIKVEPPRDFERIRFTIRNVILKSFQEQSWGGFAGALLLGVRDDLDQDVSSLYRRAGSSHVLALSGMHLGIITALLAFLLKRPFGLPFASILSLAVLILYVNLAGFQPSLTRALIMYMIIMFCFFKGISSSFLSIIALSFLIQLCLDPHGMASISAILSYGALTGIVVLGPIILDGLKGFMPISLAGIFATSLGAFITTAPLVAGFFGVLYPIGIFAGFFLGLIASLVMIGSIFYIMLYFFLPDISSFIGIVLTYIYRFHMVLLRIFANYSCEIKNVHWILVGIFSIAMTALFVYGQYRGKAKRTLSTFT